jgi:hypothetical protein
MDGFLDDKVLLNKAISALKLVSTCKSSKPEMKALAEDQVYKLERYLNGVNVFDN